MNNEPVAYVIQSNRDDSIGKEIAIPSWTYSFPQQFKKLEEDNWVKNGAAKIIPLYTHPHPDNLGLALSIIDQQKLEIERLKAKTLTDEEIALVWDKFSALPSPKDIKDFAREILRKAQEK